ncbi:hypothetical protein [Halogranum amylolyticum]|nr:hypothetical protein [Halogranum amylolyticum]
MLRARGEQRNRDERFRDYVFFVDVVPGEGYASFDTVRRYERR